jgi:hypothetical protein
MKKGKILIISHLFFPEIGIGGNRWYKFSNELSKYFEIDLLSSYSDLKKNYDYSEIIKNVFLYNNSYPKVLGLISQNFIQKILYKITLFFINLLYPSKNPYDKGILDEKAITNKINELLNLNIYDYVFITGAPFSLTYLGVLACKNNKVKVWSDLRDPWTWGMGYGMRIINQKKLKTELYREDFVIKNSNFISVPVETMYIHLQKKYPDFISKFVLLPHGYDESILPKNIKQELNLELDQLIFGGTIYNGVESFISLFFKSLENRKKPFNINLFVSNFDKTTLLYSNQSTHFYNIISNKEFLNKVHDSNFYLAFYPNAYKDYISTKIIEIIMVNTPIILVCPEGNLSNYIKSNQLGIHILPENIENDIMNWDLIIKDFKYNSKYDAKELSYANLTKKIIEILYE